MALPHQLARWPASAWAIRPHHPDFRNLLRELSAQAAVTDWSATSPVATLIPKRWPLPAHTLRCGLRRPADGPNLIRAHRDELVRASGGAAIDQMVIDIVAALFDQVLSDPKSASRGSTPDCASANAGAARPWAT